MTRPLRLPHPLILLLIGVLLAALLTHFIPAGQYDRREDSATGRTVPIAGTYHPVEPAPVSPFRAFVAIPGGLVAAAEVIVLVLLVGGAWTVVDRTGTLARVVEWLSHRFAKRGLVVVALISLAFAAGGALENMQEEIIPLIPVLAALAYALGYDAVTVAAMSAGAAMVGSAFSPLNPFQAGISLKLAQLPLLSNALLRTGMLVVALALWTWWTLRYARRNRVAASAPESGRVARLEGRHRLILLLVLAPFVAYVVGVLRWSWGFNELTAAFFIAGLAIGLVGKLGLGGTIDAYLEGARSVVAAAILIGVARSISLVLGEGRVIDTILDSMATRLSAAPSSLAALLMIPIQALLHIPVPSVSGQAVLTMPVLIPLSDLLGFARDATVLAYQTGAGLTELWTPTNGTLMAILLAAGVPYHKWLRFVAPMVILLTGLGAIGILVVLART